jgi:hypothetical protein
MRRTCGGKSGVKYWRTRMELVPELYVVETEPTSYPRAPISKKLAVAATFLAQRLSLRTRNLHSRVSPQLNPRSMRDNPHRESEYH